jgi:hypothetical protein
MMKRIWSKVVMASVLAGTVVGLGAVPQPAQARRICPPILAPVCALNPNGTRQTYSSPCIARLHHAKVLHRGKCIGGEFCTFIWAPVCAINPNSHKPETYPNLCVAEHDNAVWVHNGTCP